MNCRERVQAALSHEQPDMCPWEIGFTQGAHQKMVEYTGDPDFAEKIGNHLFATRALPPDAWVEIAPDFWRDQFGVVWNRTIDKDIGNPEPIFREPSLGDYRWPDPDDPRRWEPVARDLEQAGDRFAVLSIDFSLFERAWTMRGMTELMMDFYDRPAFVEELLDAILAYNLGIIRNAAAYERADAIYFGDDWGQQRGMLMGPELWRRFLKPRLAEQYRAVHELGKRVLIHSCGKVDEIFPDLIEIGLDCFNPFQPEVIDVFWAKREYGDRLSFFGGVSTQQLLPYGTPDQVRAQAQRLIAEVGKGGGYILAPAHGIPRDAKPENMLALIEAVQEQ